MGWVLESSKADQVRWNEFERDWEYLITLKNQPKYEATWESCVFFTTQFLDFHLEDKMTRHHGGIVRPLQQ